MGRGIKRAWPGATGGMMLEYIVKGAAVGAVAVLRVIMAD